MHRLNDVGVLLRRGYQRLPNYLENHPELCMESGLKFELLMKLDSAGYAPTVILLGDVSVAYSENDDLRIQAQTKCYSRQYSLSELEVLLLQNRQHESSLTPADPRRLLHEIPINDEMAHYQSLFPYSLLVPPSMTPSSTK